VVPEDEAFGREEGSKLEPCLELPVDGTGSLELSRDTLIESCSEHSDGR